MRVVVCHRLRSKLFGRAGMSVESLIQPLVQEFQWGEYRVVLSSTRAPVNLEDSSAVLDGKEIDVEDVGGMSKEKQCTLPERFLKF